MSGKERLTSQFRTPSEQKQRIIYEREPTKKLQT